MTDFHYLDNSATTRTTEDVADVIYNILVKDFGNPSSLHNLGFAAEKLMTQAKKDLAKVLDCSADELYFTSGGTEANNWAISSGYQLRHRRAKEVITTAFEHSSVLDSVKRLEEQGATCHYVYPDKQGHILPLDVLDLVNENTALVSLMMVNNEIGTVLPIKQLCAAIKAKNPDVLIHCDAVQAFCKLPISLSSLGVDMLTVTGHKINAPKGIGLLYVKKGVRIKPMVVGGKQQNGMRPGTENVAYACGFAHAAKKHSTDRIANYNRVAELRDYLLSLVEQNDEIIVNSPKDALPYIVNISVKGIRSETMMHFLAQKNIYVSSGSACAKGELSHVLKAIALAPDAADSALRISFGIENTKEDIIALYDAIVQAQQTLSRR